MGRRRDRPAPPGASVPLVIDDVLLITNDGRLVASYARQLRPGGDPQLVGGMFTALSDFISASMSSDEMVDEDNYVKEIVLGRSRFLVQRGKNVYIAANVAQGDAGPLVPKMAAVLARIEAQFGERLVSWDGTLGSVPGIKDLLGEVLS